MKTKNDFKIGKRVGVINETLTGIITEISAHKITIVCDDGFHYEYDPQELVPKKDWKNMIAGDSGIILESEETNVPLKKGSRRKSQSAEVDLHVHELIDTELGMSNYDKLSLQLETARQNLEAAIQKKHKRIVFIHGRGDGVLKKEIRELLKNYPVEYHDASYLKYGSGATEVIIFQNKKDTDF